MLFPKERCDKRLKPQIMISPLNRCISSEWIGQHCQEPRNPCQGSPCQNNGRCVQAISTDDQTFFSLGSADQRFSCLCEPDFGEFIFISMNIFYNVIGWLTICAFSSLQEGFIASFISTTVPYLVSTASTAARATTPSPTSLATAQRSLPGGAARSLLVSRW